VNEREKERSFSFGLNKLLKNKVEKGEKEKEDKKKKSEKMEREKGEMAEKGGEKVKEGFFKWDKKEKKNKAKASSDPSTPVAEPEQPPDDDEKVPLLDLGATQTHVPTSSPPLGSPSSPKSPRSKPQPVPQAFIKPLASEHTPEPHRIELSEDLVHVDQESPMVVPSAPHTATKYALFISFFLSFCFYSFFLS
jgi:hypothetical protein